MFDQMANVVGFSGENRLQENKSFRSWRTPSGLELLVQKVVASCRHAVIEPSCQAPHPLLLTFFHITAPHHTLETSTQKERPAKSWTIFTSPEHQSTMPEANTKLAPTAALITSPQFEHARVEKQTKTPPRDQLRGGSSVLDTVV